MESSVLEFLEQEGVRIIQTPFSAPNCNAYAERFVRSIKEECLARVIPLGERHLRRTIAEFVTHYHAERNHQGIGNELIQQRSGNTFGPNGFSIGSSRHVSSSKYPKS